MTNKNITITDVAKEAGVSEATVSRVINQKKVVKEVTVKRVLEAIEKIGYIPQKAARNLASNKTTTIGVILPEIGNEFAAQILHGIEARASESEYNLLVASRQSEHRNDLLQLPLGPHNTDGLVALSGCLSHREMKIFVDRDFPCVLLYDVSPEEFPIPSIQIENRLGTRRLIDHLVETHGYKKFAFLRGPEKNIDSEQREQGVRDSLEAHGLSISEELIGVVEYSEEISKEVVQAWIRSGKKIDVIFGGSDEGAIGALMALKDEGIAVPDEIAVVGFDDMNHVKYLTPPLTTVRSPIEQVGSLGVETLINILNGQSVERKKVLPTQLVIRQSCGCRI